MKVKMFTIAAMTVLPLIVGPAFAEQTGDVKPGEPSVKGGMPVPENVPKDKRVDLTGGQQGVPDEEYATTPVRQGKLKEITDSRWLNQPVSNSKGEKLGTIKKVLKDEKTQDIEYVMFEVEGTRTAKALKWSEFQQKGDKLVLNMNKEQLLPSVNAGEMKDTSPDIAVYKEEIEKTREESGKSMKQGNERPAGDPGSLSGAATLGEDKVGTHRAPPKTPAPQFEGDAQKRK